MKRTPFNLKRTNIKRKPPKQRKYGEHTARNFTRKKDYVKALQTKAENLWKKIGKILHGDECEVKKNYPKINITHTEIMQGDHCISRRNKYFFLDLNNHSSVCSACNQAKCFGNKSVHRAIDQIVKNRNPEWYKSAVHLDMSGEANVNWGQVWWLEEQIDDLLSMIDEINNKE